MPLDRPLLDALAVAGVGLAAVATVVAAGAQLRLARLRRQLLVLQGDGGSQSFLTAASRSVAEITALRESVRRLGTDQEALRADLADAVRHVAVVRYDAFPDLGGRLSFSVALLDDGADGVVLTTINGRTETRSYAKGVRAGGSDHALSPEERQAIEAALPRRTRSADAVTMR